MRIICRGFVAASLTFLVLGLPAVAQTDEFMKECLVTASQKMCECISSKIPADQRANAIVGLRKSNASVSVSGNLLDPKTLNQNEMQGLNAVVAAQAYCM